MSLVTVDSSKLTDTGKLDWIIQELIKLEYNMSALSDKLAEVGAAVDAAIVRVQEDVVALRQQIADLEAKVSENPTPADMAALDALKAKADALDPVVSAVLPT